MKQFSVKKIHDQMFRDFERSLKKFFKQREDIFYENFKAKVDSGEIDVESVDYPDICRVVAEEFMETQPEDTRVFVRDYVDKQANVILDNKDLDRQEAECRLEVLKYMLLAADW